MNNTQLAELKAEIFQLPKNSTPLFPYGERRQLVADLLDAISFLRHQEYSYEFISEFLEEKSGISIQPKTLRRYFFEEQAKLRDKQPTDQRRRKASPGQLKSRSSTAARPVDETIAASPVAVAEQPKPKKVKAKADKTPAEPKSRPQPEPEPEEVSVATEASDDDWGVGWNDDDDDSYTTGLINEPTFNRIRRS